MRHVHTARTRAGLQREGTGEGKPRNGLFDLFSCFGTCFFKIINNCSATNFVVKKELSHSRGEECGIVALQLSLAERYSLGRIKSCQPGILVISGAHGEIPQVSALGSLVSMGLLRHQQYLLQILCNIPFPSLLEVQSSQRKFEGPFDAPFEKLSH